jgi:hypothetical protein
VAVRIEEFICENIIPDRKRSLFKLIAHE